MNKSQSKICFIGGGNMARAIIAGAVVKGFLPSQILVMERHQEKCQALHKMYGVSATMQMDSLFAAKPMLYILAVKPQNFAETLHLYHAALNQEGIGVVSLAPAISLQCLQKKLPRSQLVRVMPNTPSAIHRGVTGMVANALLDIEIKTLVEQLFSSIGICAWVADEKQLDVVTALSGSGPAYYFCIVEIFIKKAIEKGLPETLARDFAVQTLLGAAELATQQGAPSISQLREQVTSKGGVTAKALLAMQESGIERVVEKTMDAAIQRMREMAKEFSL